MSAPHLDPLASGHTTLAPVTPSERMTPSSVSVDPEKAGLGGSSRASVGSGELVPAPKTEYDEGTPEIGVRKIRGVTWALVSISILSSIFLFALDNTIVADVQPKIVARFDSIEKLPWLSVAFLLGAVSTNLIWGRIYGQFNAKYLYLISVFLFEVGSAVCGAAPTMNALIVGRTLAGLGGAGMYIGVMTLLAVNTTEQERPTYIGLTGISWGIGTLAGPAVGAGFAQNASATWRWAFYINLVIGAAAAPVYIFLIPGFDPRPGVPMKARIRELDFVGAILIMGAFVSGAMAISFGGQLYAWRSGQIIGLFVCSALLFIIFGIQQTFTILTTVDRRVFPVHFLKRRTMLILFAMTASAVTVVFVPLYFIPLFFQFVRDDSPLKSAVRLLPFISFVVFVVILNGVLMSKYGHYVPWYVLGGVMAIIGSALMYATVHRDTPASRVYGYLILLGVAGGAYCQASFSVAQAKVTPSEISLAVGFITCGQIGGATIALAIANSVFLNRSTAGIVQLVPNVPIGTVRSAISGASSSFFASLSADKKRQVLEVLVDAIDRIYILPLAAGALTLVLSAFLKRERLFIQMAAAA